TGIPRGPAILLGIISLRGVIVPLFDLKQKLTGIQEKPEIYADGAVEEVSAETLRRNIILMSGGGLLGLEVDSVTDVIRIREKEIESAPPLLDSDGQDLIKGVFRFKNRMVILLNNHNMIGMIEREIHADMAA
ncbi:MAG TPA: chemotaxis protein CheW, partial [Nitrospiria bacterium]|nr:chemotaxis protein CheW [Nitrospiria bacterium]